MFVLSAHRPGGIAASFGKLDIKIERIKHASQKTMGEVQLLVRKGDFVKESYV